MYVKPFKPILAAPLVRPTDSEDMLLWSLKQLEYPVLATPKLDGIRCITIPGVRVGHILDVSTPVCRSLKPVPNEYVRDLVSQCPSGLDGELMTYSERDLLDQGIGAKARPFNSIQSDIMNRSGVMNFKYHVFDANVYAESALSVSYRQRTEELSKMILPKFVVKVLPQLCKNADELQAYMAKCIADGHEGICFRKYMYCPYKYGRSTLKQQLLIKWKLFDTSEAEIIGFEEEMQNNNVPVIGLTGYQERSSHQENMVGKNRLGAFICKTSDGIEFKVGTGFTTELRESYWNDRVNLVGQLVTYKHQGHGAKTAPRIPVFVGIRSKLDL